MKLDLFVSQTYALLREGSANINILPDSDNIILVIGNNGAGKSTMTRFLTGDNSQLEAYKKYGSSQITIRDHFKQIPTSKLVSNPTFPVLQIDQQDPNSQEKNVIFYDCPGFSDTLNSTIKILNTYFLKQVIASGKGIKIILVVNHKSLGMSQDLDDFYKLMRHTAMLLKNIEKFHKSLILLATFVNSPSPDEQIVREIGEFLKGCQQQGPQNWSHLLQSLLQKDKWGNCTRLTFFPQPTQLGLLSQNELVQQRKLSIKHVLKNAQYAEISLNDFSFPLEAPYLTDMRSLAHAVQNGLQEIIQELSLRLLTLDSIKFNTSKNSDRELQNVGQSSTFTPLKYLQNFISNNIGHQHKFQSYAVKDLCNKISSHVNETDLTMLKILRNISNHANYLEFFEAYFTSDDIPPRIKILPFQVQTISLHGSAYFNCKVIAGFPPPVISWRRASGLEIPATASMKEGYLSFDKVTPYEEGEYACLAENIAGRVMMMATVNIIEMTSEGNHSFILPTVVTLLVLTFIGLCIGIGVKIRKDQKRIQQLSLQVGNMTVDDVAEFHNGIQVSNLTENDDQETMLIHSLPFNSEYEIPRERLVLHENKVLGSGEFGIVKEGILKRDGQTQLQDLTVAVKMAHAHVEVANFKALLSEIKIMAYLGRHPNIVSLFGTVTSNIENREVFAAMEFCENRDLLRYLKAHRWNFVNLWDDKIKTTDTQDKTNSLRHSASLHSASGDGEVVIKTSQDTVAYDAIITRDESVEAISTLDLLNWSHQIANGMAYLATKKVIHGDLAARNVLLTSNNVAKISDFGLSRQLVNYSLYTKTSVTPLPWRWLAIESLTDRTFTLNSDIWSFGVTLWELFSLGTIPYPGRTWDNVFVNEIIAGQRLPSPQMGNDDIFNLMLNCTKQVPAERMPFLSILYQLDKIRMDLTREMHYTSKSTLQKCIYFKLE